MLKVVGLGVATKIVFVKHSRVPRWNAKVLKRSPARAMGVGGLYWRRELDTTREQGYCTVTYNASQWCCRRSVVKVARGRIGSEVKVYCARHNVSEGPE